MPINPKSVDPFGLFDGYTEPDTYTAPEADKVLIQNLQEWFDAAYDAKQSYEREWETHRLYLKGEVVARNKLTGETVRLADDKSLKSRNNMLRPIARSLIGKLSKMIPTCTVMPATADFAEQHAARVADAIIQYLRRKEDLDVKYLAINNFLPWAGNAFVQVVWDPTAGQKIAYCQICDFYDYTQEMIGAPCPRCDAQRQQELLIQSEEQSALMANISADILGMAQPGQPAPPLPEELPPAPPLHQTGPLAPDSEVPQMVEAWEGDVRFPVRDPRDVFTPPGCIDIRQASRICIREAVEVALARKRFPKFAQFIHAEDGLFSDKMAQWKSSYLDTSGSVEWLTDHVYVYEFHEAATELYPKGRIIYLVNGMIVEETESLYHCVGRIPIYHFGFDVNDGEFWREPFLTHAWHRQRELDTIETITREYAELTSRPKWLVPAGARISQDEFTPQSAQVIEYNAMAGRPMPLELPQMPQPVYQRRVDLMADMRMQAAVTDQEQGLTTSDPNGRAMAIINAEADQTIGPITVRNHAEWREMHRGALILVQKYYHPDRKITVAGPEGLQTYSFNEVNLQPGWDVQLEDADGLSRNPAIRFNEVLQLATIAQGAFFIDPKTMMFDKKAFARMAKLKMPDQGYDAEATERAAAQRMIYQITQGLQPSPRSCDEPGIFFEEFLGWLRGPGRSSDPMMYMQVEMTWRYYANWKVMVDMGMLQPGVLPGVVPGQEGGPSQPGQGGMSAPGGTPNNPGMLGTDLAPGLAQDAEQRVQQADGEAEGAAINLGV